MKALFPTITDNGGLGVMGLGSRSLSSMSLARPIAWEKEYGLRMESSLRISGWSPEIKQLSIISGVSPTT